jgi:enoyl-CoA hydratase
MSLLASRMLRPVAGLACTAARSTSAPAVTTTVPTHSPRFFSGTSDSLKDSYENILVDTQQKKGVALITLNRPKALNALNDALFSDLIHASQALDVDDSVGCLVLTGSEKAFAAGADISEMQSRTFDDAYSRDMFSEWQQMSKLTSKPIIAAVSGFCLGGGCELAMMCDIMVCSATAKFGQPEINLGVIPGTWRAILENLLVANQVHLDRLRGSAIEHITCPRHLRSCVPILMGSFVCVF